MRTETRAEETLVYSKACVQKRTLTETHAEEMHAEETHAYRNARIQLSPRTETHAEETQAEETHASLPALGLLSGRPLRRHLGTQTVSCQGDGEAGHLKPPNQSAVSFPSKEASPHPRPPNDTSGRGWMRGRVGRDDRKEAHSGRNWESRPGREALPPLATRRGPS